MQSSLFIVAAGALEGDLDERASTLSRVLGLTPYEAHGRVQPPAPRVLATFGAREPAERLVTELAGLGFVPILLAGDPRDEAATRVDVRSFARVPDGWRFETRDGWQRLVEDASLRLMLKVSTTSSESRTDQTTERRFSLGKAVVTGGLSFTRKQTIETTTTTSSTHTSILLVADGHPTFVFRESDLQFQGLGSAMLPTRQANWQRFATELRARTPIYDERLANRAGQVHLLGGVLTPERHLDVAVALLRRALQGA